MVGSDNTPMTVCFDLDGTLCTNTYGAYDEAEPFPWAIARVNALAEAGHRIIVFTARGTATGLDWRETTEGQLQRWGVRYDELQLGKPSAAVYVDDRAVHTTAWREGDAWAVPGFGVPAPEGRREPLPEPLALQRTTVVESGRTYGGVPFLAEEHVDRVLRRAAGAGIAELPEPRELTTALDTALARARAAGEPDVVFTFAVADGVAPGFLDVADERAGGGVVTVRSIEQARAGLAGSPATLGGRRAAAIDGRLVLGDAGDRPGPLGALLEE
ncbi:MAG TPA: hypothetical protein VFY44_05780, partial [Thermoleophilaceae bacterium]|nr:hypothetical protein [Thermoleophilaceae bacterium]